MDLYLKGKTAVITGASQGIGRAITKELALEGVKVFAVARNEVLLGSLKTEIEKEGGTVPVTFIQDIVLHDGPEIIAEAAIAEFGRVDILINNAGKSQPVDIVGGEQQWIDSMALDFEAPRKLTHALLPHMLMHKSGSILNITSTYELRSINVSSIAKAAVVMWSKQLASQLGRHGITVNCLQPGLIDTENTRRIFTPDERKAYATLEIPLQDFGDPKDMANMATFLVSPRARYVTGTVVVVDGGAKRFAF